MSWQPTVHPRTQVAKLQGLMTGAERMLMAERGSKAELWQDVKRVKVRACVCVCGQGCACKVVW